MTTVDKNKINPFAELSFDEALKRLIQTDKGELANAIAKELVDHLNQTRESVEAVRKDIARGARTREKKDRFRL